VALGAAAALAVCAWAVSPSFAAGHRPHHCAGSLKAGIYRHGLIVSGVCKVNAGAVRVIGLVTVKPGSALIAGYGMNGSKLRVDGDIVVGRSATLVLGCNTTSFTCVDDAGANATPPHPTLSSHDRVTGSVTSTKALGVIVHNTEIDGNVIQTGGGGGDGPKVCTSPPAAWPLGAFGVPVYSDYEDNTIAGDVSVKNLRTCWLGLGRDRVGKSMSIVGNKLADPDGIEILSNHIHGNLACRRNGHPSPEPPGTMPVWDSNELSMTNAIYPRRLDRNHVHGKRFGQCVKAGPLTMGGGPAGGPF
jgi:hypothetical protein